jgi:hypothetical protein
VEPYHGGFEGRGAAGIGMWVGNRAVVWIRVPGLA